MTTAMPRRMLLGAAAFGLWAAGCCPSNLAPDIQRPGARVSTANQKVVAGLVHAADWPSLGLPTPPPAQPGTCPQDRQELEDWLGNHGESCDRVRGQQAQPSGSGDDPVSVPVAPHCYCLGKVMLVVEYEMARTNCTRIVGLSVLPRQ